MQSFSDRRTGHGRRGVRQVLLPLVVVLLGLTATVAASSRIARSEGERYLDRELAERTGAISSAIAHFGGLIAGASAHFSRTPHDPATVTDQRLRDYLAAVDVAEHYPELSNGLTYVVRVDRAEIDAYVRRRRDSLPDFTVADGPYRIYLAVVWAQSAGWAPHGARLDSNPILSTALAEAHNRETVIMTAPVAVPEEDTSSVYLFGPVLDVLTGEALGWVGTVIDIPDFMAQTAQADQNYALSITDNNVRVSGEPVPPEVDVIRHRTNVPLLGREWMVEGTAEIALLNLPSLIAGTSLTLLGAALVANLQRSSRRLRSDVLAIRRSRDRWATFVETVMANVDVGIVACDRNGKIILGNSAAVRMTGEVPLGTAVAEWLAAVDLRQPDRRPLLGDELPLHQAMQGVEVRAVEVLVSREGEERTLLVDAQPIRDVDDLVVGAVMALNDITERKATEAKMTRLAMHDHLTGLGNRRMLTQALKLALRTYSEGGPQVTLLSMDLDRFKSVNDNNGHHVGDRLLVAVARRLEDQAHDGDVTARIGGDEFVLLCTHLDSGKAAEEMADRLVRTLTPVLLVEEYAVSSGVSVGVVQPQRGATVADVLRQADLAMYEAKSEPDTSVKVYEPSLGIRSEERFTTEAALRQALRDEELSVAFQPIVHAGDRRIVGVEALVRWWHQGVLRPPSAFLPVAEESDLITEIDLWVLRQACAVINRPNTPAMVSVNLSGRTLAHADLLARIVAIVDATGVAADRLSLELTETVLIGASPQLDRTLQGLTDLGVRLAIDDFGTGYASLNYLRRFPIDTIKIDRSFVADLADSPGDRAIVASTIDLAHRLELDTIAEGVETELQAEILRDLGCALLQGYLLGRPGRLDDILRGHGTATPRQFTPTRT